MINRVLVGIDFSPASRRALITAKFWAEKIGVPLVAMHVVHVPKPLLEEAYPALYNPGMNRSMEEEALKRLQEWIHGIADASATVALGSPAETLLAAADPDTLLVVGQIGHTGIEHLLFGSTAARVVRHAPCDVLVVRCEKKTS